MPSRKNPVNSTLWNLLDPAKLVRLLDIAMDALAADTGWQDADDATILRHQFAATLFPDLLIVPGLEEPRLRAAAESLPEPTFIALLTSGRPPLELLEAVKLFARHVHDDPQNPLRGFPADVLYFAAIAAALVHCQTRITRLDDADLRAGLQRAASHPGAEPLAKTLHAAAAAL